MLLAEKAQYPALPLFFSAPKHLHKLRVLAAKAVVGTGTSCCLTTDLALSGKPMADPGVRLRVEAIVLWSKLARKLLEPKRASLSRAWSRALAAFRKLDGKSPWKLVKGPMAATIATLLDIGWDPRNPTLWKDERGTSGTSAERMSLTASSKPE